MPAPRTPAAATPDRTPSRSGRRSSRPRGDGPPSAPARPLPPRRYGTGRVSPQLTGERLGEPEVVGRRHLQVVGRVGHDVHGQAREYVTLGVDGWRGLDVRTAR